MPKINRTKTIYPGVYFIEGISASGKSEKIFYIRYRKDGQLIEEKAGRQFQDDMTPARAAGIRADRVEGKQPSNRERRETKKKAEHEKKENWTIDRIYQEYIKGRPNNKSRKTDEGRYNNYIKQSFGNKQPKDIIPLDVDRLRIKLTKKLSPQTVKHILNLLTWIINFAKNKNLCDGISFHIQKPAVNNEKTEDLTTTQLSKLLDVIESDTHPQAGPIMKMALFTGIRRGEMFKLKWEHIDFERGFILIKDPIGGPDQKIPLNDAARELLGKITKTDSPFVFPGRGGRRRTDINKAVNQIKKEAGLPKDFRPLHGLRHVYASMLASSGQVDMYTLQKLLTHKSPQMTQRYAHLRDDALKRAANLAGDLVNEAVQYKKGDKKNEIG